jgi:hypothetical protein
VKVLILALLLFTSCGKHHSEPQKVWTCLETSVVIQRQYNYWYNYWYETSQVVCVKYGWR